MKKMIYSALFSSTFLFLLLFPEKGIRSAADGLLLWYRTLLPTLLPMMIISGVLLQSGIAALLAQPLYRLTGPALHLSANGTYALIIGFLCGFPMGVHALSELRKRQQISENEAVYLAAFCNNVSPAFLQGYVLHRHMAGLIPVFWVLLIVYGSPLFYGLLTNVMYRKKNHARTKPQVFLQAKNKTSLTAPDFAMIDVSIINGIHNITKIGGYIILFSVFSSMLNLLPPQLSLIKSSLIGITEITTGIHELSLLHIPQSLKYILLLDAAAFGGLCAIGQSKVMLDEIGITLAQYLRARATITGIATLLAAVCIR